MPFDVTVWINNSEKLIQVSGDFRSGLHFEKMYNTFASIVMAFKSELTIDLTRVSFMDSDSMNLIHKCDTQGVKIKWDESGFAFKRYVEKYQDARRNHLNGL